MSELLHRYAQREQLTQALAYGAALQDRGWACLVSGASLLIMRARDGGVFARMQRPRTLDPASLEAIVARAGVTRLLVEPAIAGDVFDPEGASTPWQFTPDDADAFAAVPGLGWTPSENGIAHTKTQIVDLAPEMPDVVASFATVARRNVRKAQAARSVSYSSVAFGEVSDRDRAEIRRLYKAFLEERPYLPDDAPFRDRMLVHFARRGWFVTASDATGLLGVIYLVVHDRVGYYQVAFSDPRGRDQRVATGLVYAAMTLARSQGCDLFDFVGLWDERTPKRFARWKGFTTFKQRFGGQAVYFPPPFEAVG